MSAIDASGRSLLMMNRNRRIYPWIPVALVGLILSLPLAGETFAQCCAAVSEARQLVAAAEGSACKAGTEACGRECTGPCPWDAGAKAAKTDGWVRIFNGENLDGWQIMGGNKEAFYVKDGVIECNGKGGEWIRYKEELGDFILRLEYKISQGGNSGVFLRSQEKGHPAYTGFEVQVLDDSGRPPDIHTSGAIYDVLTPMVNMSKPAGEWNEYIITCKGPHVTVLMNDVMVIDTNFDWFTKPIGKFSTPYAQLPRAGYIGMQDHGNYVWYRDIWLKELK
jgi:hypothetical protein